MKLSVIWLECSTYTKHIKMSFLFPSWVSLFLSMWAITSKYHTETKLYTTIGLFLSFLHPLYLITKFCHFTFFLVLLLLSIILLPLNSFRAFLLKSNIVGISSIQLLSRVRLFATPWTAAPQASLSITNSQGLLSNSGPWSEWCHPTISSFVIPFSFCLQSLQYPGLFKWVSSSHQEAKVLEFQLQHQSFQWIFND